MYPKVTFIDIVKAFWRGLKPKAPWFYFLIFCIIAGNLAVVVTPMFYRRFFDVVAQASDRTAAAPELFSIIMLIALGNFAFWLFYRCAEIANVNYQMNTIARLKQLAYDYLMGHSYSFFSNNFVGSLVQRVNRFARAYERLSDRVVWDIIPLAIRVLAIFFILVFIHPMIAVVILLWAAVYIAGNAAFSRWKLKYDLRVAEADSKATGYLADTLGNHHTVTLFDGFSHESSGFRKATDHQAGVTKFSWSLDAVINASQAFLIFAAEFILFFSAIYYWERNVISVGVFVLLQAYLIALIGQLWNVTRVVRDLYQAYADAKEMVEIMMLPHDIKNIPQAKELQVKKGIIEFQNLHFAFHETRNVLNDISLKIRPGERVALIGPSGAGKTTLIRLLLRLYSPTAGKITIDGQDIAKVTQESLRRNISVVAQEAVLFHRTLADNISYGRRSASRKEIEKAAKLAHCNEFIKNLPRGLDTFVGERGVKLSGGERQRVAIARAMLKNAPILILDEATSSLDSHSEALIQDALDTLMRGKTTLVIAHRLSTIRKMDRILVIDGGVIIEDGSHRQLLAKKKSLYRKLWTLQAEGFLINDKEDKLTNGEKDSSQLHDEMLEKEL